MPTNSTNIQPAFPPVATIARHYDSLDYFNRDIWGEHIHHGLWLDGGETPREAAEQLSRRYWQLLLYASASDRIFGVTACRIWAAYRTGCMHYASFTCP
jgi:hypothetical protein